MCGAQLAGPLQLAFVDIDANDGVSARQAGAGDGRVTHSAASDDGDGVAASDVAGVHGGAQASHHSAADEAGGQRAGGRIDLDGLEGVDQGQLAKGADAQRGRQWRAVGQGHLLLGVAAGEAVPRPTAQARPAVSARSPPGEDHEIAGRNVGHVRADLLNHAGRLVAQQEGEVVVDRSLTVVQVGVTDTARLHAHQRLAFPRIRYQDGNQFHRSAPRR